MQRKNLARFAIVAGLCSSLALPTAVFADQWITDESLNGVATAQPQKDDIVPNKGQYKYAKEELAAFCHFGPNTFSGVEWGTDYGTKMPSAVTYMNNLETFDAEGYVKMIKEAGFKRLVVTAKHHDGFCIWNSESTDYDMGSTTSRIDILAELSKACSTYDLDMGLYLSPWDIHEPSYGNKDGKPDNYNDFYDGQLREILGDPKCGNKGKFVEVWMDGAKGTGADAQNYNFERFAKTIKELEGDECVLFQCGLQSEVRWVGNENGLAGDTAWNRVEMNPNWDSSSAEVPWNKNIQNDPTVGAEVSVGSPTGGKWIMPEADARITAGWFWHNNMKTPKTLTELSNMYFNSVGHGAPLLLNVPPNDTGTVDPEIKQRTLDFGDNVEKTFAQDLTREGEGRTAATAKASSAWENDPAYGPGKVLDGKDETYWSAKDATGTQSLLIEFPEERTFNVVSFEEAIQNGQHIKNFAVSYRDAGGQWVEYGKGGTVGAKRLVRGSNVTASAIKIDLSTLDGKVAQISEVGVFKTTKAFEKPMPVPEGMEILDNAKMQTSSGWNQEKNASFIDGTSMWTGQAGATATFQFDGTKFMLMGTVDPNHGHAKITIDGKEPIEINTRASKRATSVPLFTSDTLEAGTHTVKIEVVGGDKGAVGIDAAAYLNNNGAGMIDFDVTEITMDENSVYELGVTRSGGSTGRAEVVVNFEPGSAVQGDFDTDSKHVVFNEGETHKTVQVRTKRVVSSSTIGNGQFYVTMAPVSPEGLVIGSNDDVTVTIIDRESNYTLEKLKEAIQNAEAAANAGQYTAESVRVLDKALVTAHAVVAKDNPSADAIFEAMKVLQAAQSGLEIRKAYSEDEPFAFPSIVGTTSTIEFELGVLHNDTTGDNNWPMAIKDRDGASLGKLVDSVGENDTIAIPFTVERAGTYNVKLRYMSGSSNNKVVWTDANADDPIIAKGEHAAGHTNADAYQTVDFTFTVNKPGTSQLVFKGPKEKSPRLDKLDITLAADSLTSFGAVGRAGVGGTVTPEGFVALKDGKTTFTVTPDEGYRIASITKNGTPVDVAGPTSTTSVEVTEVDTESGDAVVEAVFEKIPAPSPEPEPEPDPQPRPDPHPEPDPQPQPDPQPEPEPQPQPDPKPETGNKPNKKPAGTNGPLPQTGDIAAIAAPVALSASALIGAATALRKKRR